MWEFVLALLLGIVVGTFTGITPGIHINTITAVLLANLSVFSSFSTNSLIAFIVSLAIAHTILDFIPSILTGATDEESFLSVLPGHEMLKQGKGKEAILMVLIGVITSIPLILIITPFFIKLIPFIYLKITFFIPFILIFISVYLITREDRCWTALVIFLATGLLGFSTLNSPVENSLLPLLGGLFGTLISSPFCSFLPGIGSGHAATISSEIIPQSRKGFLMMLGTINILIMVLSFATLYSIDKTRTGASVAIKEILGELSISNLKEIIFISLIVIIVTSVIAILITNLFIKLMEKISYNKISICMLLILISIVIISSSWLGLLVFITSTAWGIFAILSNVRRINMMGVLLFPTIIFYLTNQF